jgi:hypothetical protein
MNRLKSRMAIALFAIAALVITLGPIATIGCKSTPSRQTYTTLATVGQAVDMAEREYLDRVVAGQIKVDGQFTQIQAGYSAFQQAYKAALAVSMNDSNALSPPNLSALAAKLISDINQAKGAK